MLKKQLQKGFTIVELLIVIVVIGILAALVLNTFSGIQARARDTERQTDVNSIATQLEVYYNDNGNYPLLTDELNDDTWVEDNLPGMDLDALRAPGSDSNSMTADAPDAADPNRYQYRTFESDGSVCAAAPCEKFTLTWWSEEDEATKDENSLN